MFTTLASTLRAPLWAIASLATVTMTVTVATAQPYDLLLDADRDGMLDTWELSVGLNAVANDRLGDPDGDGHNNYLESVAGTDPFDAASAPRNRYVFLNIARNASDRCVSYSTLTDGNDINIDAGAYEEQNLPLGSRQNCVGGGVVREGSVIESLDAVSVQGNGNATDMPVPFSFAGTRFAIPHVRYSHLYSIFSPAADAQVSVVVDAIRTDMVVPQGQVLIVDAGEANNSAGVIMSDVPVIVAHAGRVGNTPNVDAYAVPPAAYELFGITSRYADVAATEDETRVTVFAENGQKQQFTLRAGEKRRLTVGAKLRDGRGSAVRILADRPVAAVQYADGDGTETTAFHDRVFWSTDVGVPLSAEYIVAVCAAPGATVSLYSWEIPEGGFASRSEQCSPRASGEYPAKVVFDLSPGKLAHLGGMVESTVPVHVVFEDVHSEDERNTSGIAKGDRERSFVLDPRLKSADANAYPLEGAATLRIGSEAYSLSPDVAVTLPGTLLSEGTVINGDAAYVIAGNANASESPIPAQLAGTAFAVPHLREGHTYFLFNPGRQGANSRSDVVVRVGTGQPVELQLQPGEWRRLDVGTENAGVAGLINATRPIAVMHRAQHPTRFYLLDAFPVPPGARELLGVKSGQVQVAALEQDTQITIHADGGGRQTMLLAAGEHRSVWVGSRNPQGQGSALRIVADKPITAAQFADGDGNEATAFLPLAALGQRYVVPVDAQYLAIACSEPDTVISVRDSSNTSEIYCSADGLVPGKVYVGQPQNGAHIAAGTTLTGNRPFYVYYESSVTDDERNLFGVRADNISPRFTSEPSTVGFQDQPYIYASTATDAELDTLDFELIEGPAGMTAGSLTGLVEWTNPAPGRYQVRLEVTDGRGGFGTQAFDLTVEEVGGNQSPTISSSPPADAVDGVPYAYDVVANDPDDDPLTFTLNAAPEGMTIDEVSGALSWIPGEPGDFNVELSVSDGQGGEVSQAFVVTVDSVGVTLNPVGDQSVTLGRRLGLQLSATTNSPEPARFLVRPVPLPPNLQLNAETGEVSFAPDADQVGPLEITFEAIVDGAMNAETITIDVVSPVSAETVLSGQVITVDAAPLPDVRLEIGGIETTTNASGNFTLTGIPFGSVRLLIDGSGVDPSRGTFATVPEIIDVIEGADNLLEPAIVLLPLDVESADMVLPTAMSVVTSSPIEMEGTVFEPVTLTVPAGRAFNEATGELYEGPVHISPIPDPSLGPRPLPPEFDLGVYIAMQPFGVVYDPPIPISFPNVEGFPPESIVDMFALNHDTGVMEDIGDGRVSADGRTIDSIGGVVRSNSWHGIVPQAPVTEPYEPEDKEEDEECEEKCGSRVGTQSGSLIIEHSVPTYRSLNATRGVTLVYNSSSAHVRPIIGTQSQIGNFSPPPTSMSMRLSIGGIDQGKERFSLAGTTPGSARGTFKRTRPSVQFDASDLDTGVYPYTIAANCFFPVSRRSEFLRGNKIVRNEASSPFGAGWTIQALDRLYPQGIERVLLARGDGASQVFTRADVITPGGDPLYRPPAGEFSSITRRVDQTYVRSKKDGMQQTFNPDGMLVSEVDRNGNATLYAYDLQGRLATITDPVGLQTTLTYSPTSGRLASITDPATRLTQFAHDPEGNLKTITNPDGTVRSFEYDRYTHLLRAQINERNHRSEYNYNFAGRIDNVKRTDGSELRRSPGIIGGLIDPTAGFGGKDNPAPAPVLIENVSTDGTDGRGNPVRYATASSGAMTQRTDAAGRTTQYKRDPEYNIETITRTNESVVRRTHDIRGNVETVTEEFNGATTTYTYDAFSLVTSVKDPRANVMLLERDIDGNLQLIRNALGHETAFNRYDSRGLLAEMTSANGLVTTYGYNARGLVETVTETPPIGAGELRVTTYSYDAAGNLTVLESPDGTIVTMEYDNHGRLERTEDNIGDFAMFDHDEAGNLVGADFYNSDGSLIRTLSSRFDERDRPSGTTLPHVPGENATTTQTYDGNGNPAVFTDARMHVTRETYDVLNRLEKHIDARDGETQYEYDDNNMLTSLRAPNGTVTTFTYDKLGRRETETSPDRGTQTYTYDVTDNLKTVTDARSVILTYEYDELNRVQSKRYPDATLDVTYEYDECAFGVGMLCARTDSSGRYEYEYDVFSNIVEMRYIVGGVTFTTEYRYDAGDNVIGMTLPSGRAVSYERDTVRRIVGISAEVSGAVQTLVEETDYRGDGQISRRLLGNGLTERRRYDLQGRLESQSLDDMSDAIDTKVYSYDANGNLLSRLSEAFSGIYDYDELDRLTEDTVDQRVRRQIYDPNGNRLARNTGASEPVEVYRYESGTNRLIELDVLDLAAPVGRDEPNLREFVYDDQNRIVEVLDDGVSIATYTYNAEGQRTQKATADGIIVFHYGLSGDLLSETKADGSPMRDYIWGESGPSAQIDGNGFADSPTWLHLDHLTTPRIATSDSGTIVWRWDGRAFGEDEPTSSDGAGLPQVSVSIRFPGQYFDEETGLTYNHSRYYAVSMGRYLSSDPIGLVGGMNGYSYSSANPLRFIDPLGLAKITGRWLETPFVRDVTVFRPGVQLGGPEDTLFTLVFPVSGEIFYKIGCTKEDECGNKETWQIGNSQDFKADVSISESLFAVEAEPTPLPCFFLRDKKLKLICQILNSLKIADKTKEARDMANKHFDQAAALLRQSVNPTNFCRISDRF